ncbi:hypothetical protein M8A51_19165 [Schlegelella sp. S2-27]|uniref:Transcription regulator MAATS C-terminal domain-containing protein n=2 Tax=Caldimonas mangrovi TaxID=2944811 RepID=A0ABT0YSE4_9BURK|nr:hypothetical protein [Caldimonas mangrovi]
MQFSDSVSDDPSVRHTMEILNFKCEFVGEMQQDLADYVVHSEECLSKLQRTYQAAQRNGDLRTGISPKMAAMETLVFLTGLLRLRLLGVPALQTRRELNALIAAHVDSRRQAG